MAFPYIAVFMGTKQLIKWRNCTTFAIASTGFYSRAIEILLILITVFFTTVGWSLKQLSTKPYLILNCSVSVINITNVKLFSSIYFLVWKPKHPTKSVSSGVLTFHQLKTVTNLQYFLLMYGLWAIIISSSIFSFIFFFHSPSFLSIFLYFYSYFFLIFFNTFFILKIPLYYFTIRVAHKNFELNPVTFTLKKRTFFLLFSDIL